MYHDELKKDLNTKYKNNINIMIMNENKQTQLFEPQVFF